jgi:uncharacterized membrane protein
MKFLRFPFIPKLYTLLQKHFFTGILVITPFVIIVWILFKTLGLLSHLQTILPLSWRPESWILSLVFTAGVSFLILLGISILGWASKLYLGQKLLELLSEIIHHIPVLRSIYGALEQLMNAMTPGRGGGQQFSRVVYIEWPRKGIWVIAFVTSPAKGTNLPSGFLNVFLPATPNPTSGFHLIVAEEEVREASMTVEAAFKTILSLGLAQSSASPLLRGHSDEP